MSGDRVLGLELSRIGLKLPVTTEEKLAVYAHELERWNKKLNLTSLKGAELVRRLIVEPAWIGEELQLSGSLADIGSGNGSPAVSLCVTRPIARAHWIEARTKRAAFLRHVVQRLDLKTVTVHRNCAEDIEEKIEVVDCISLQAVNPTPQLAKALRRIFPGTTRVVWITSGAKTPAPDASRISVPGSNSEVWIFRLDQI